MLCLPPPASVDHVLPDEGIVILASTRASSYVTLIKPASETI
jgi:hypothetical protein